MTLTKQPKNGEFIGADDGAPTVALRDVTGDAGDIALNNAHYVAGHVVPTVADLANVDVVDGRENATHGYYSALDGGGRSYRYSAVSAATVDGGSVLNGPGGVGRYLARDNLINVLQWGFVGDNVTDNSARHSALITWLKTRSPSAPPIIYFPAGFYLFSGQAIWDLPCLQVVGDGPNASFLVGNAGQVFNYPQPVIRDLGIVPAATTSSGTGLELRNCWQAIMENVMIHDFDMNLLLKLDDEGEGLIAGNTPGGPYPVSQFSRHDTWPSLQEFVRDSKTTTEHWGSRISIVRLVNLHIKGEAGQSGIYLQNTLADVTNDYDDFNNLSGTTLKQGIFYTDIQIRGGHLFCRDKNLRIGGGVHDVTVDGTYLDSELIGVQIDYGAQNIKLKPAGIDFGAGQVQNWRPKTLYAVDDVVRAGGGYRQYKCTGAGTSATNVNHNGCPNSEWVGVDPQLSGQPVVGGANPNDLPTQAKVYGLDVLSTEVEVFIEGVEVINGVRWLNLATWLRTTFGGSQTANFWFADLGFAGRNLDAISGDQIQASFKIQHRNPRATHQPDVVGRIRASASNGSFTEQSAGSNIHSLLGFEESKILTFTDTYTLADGSTSRVSPYLAVTYTAGQEGLFRFRIAQPQINEGASLGAYVRTTGQPRSRWQDGPQTEGTSIADGTATWDFDGDPISTIIAPRKVFETNKSETKGELTFEGNVGRFLILPGVNPPPDYVSVKPNPTNSNGHPTTLAD